MRMILVYAAFVLVLLFMAVLVAISFVEQGWPTGTASLALGVTGIAVGWNYPDSKTRAFLREQDDIDRRLGDD